jgi:hypothetical protein
VRQIVDVLNHELAELGLGEFKESFVTTLHALSDSIDVVLALMRAWDFEWKIEQVFDGAGLARL